MIVASVIATTTVVFVHVACSKLLQEHLGASLPSSAQIENVIRLAGNVTVGNALHLI